MQPQRYQRNCNLMFRATPALLLVVFGLLYVSCTGTTLPFLQHFKHPKAVTAVKVADGTNSRYHLYVANADLDRLSVVNVTQRSLLIDQDNNTPGILYIQAGRRPVDLATSPDQKRIYSLHAIDGNIWVFDTNTNKPLVRNNKPLMIPSNCARQPGCWSGPIKLLVYPRKSPSQLLGFVALAGENAIAVVNLNESDPDNFGKELSRIRLTGRPTDMWFGPEKKNIYVSNGSEPFVHVIEAETLSIRNLSVEAKTLTGSTSLDSRWLYLIDSSDNSIRIYDLKENKVVPSGDNQPFATQNIHVPGQRYISFLKVKFLPPVSITVRDSSGNDRILTKSFAWANASDGYGYLIDPDEYTNKDGSQKLPPHRVLDSIENGPGVSNIRVSVAGDSLGDPRQPVRPFVPKLSNNSSNTTGIKLFDGKTRTETWTLTYQGEIVPQRSGRISNPTSGEFVDALQFNLVEQGVKAKDTLILYNCGTATPSPDASTTSDEPPPAPTCEIPIQKVDGYILTLDPKKLAKLPTANQTQWAYSIRSSNDYTVEGSLTGRLKLRVIEGVPFLSDYFSLEITRNKEDTRRDTRIQFDTSSGFSPKRLRMGGLPTVIHPQDNHLLCGGSLCNLENCRTHPACTNNACEDNSQDQNKRCNAEERCNNGKCVPSTKLWILDSAGSRLFVINPKDNITLETTIR